MSGQRQPEGAPRLAGSERTGRLVLCPTPLGNLEDITLRTLRALRECDLIFAEDTRVSQTLLRHYEIKKPVRSFHERVEAARLNQLRRLLDQGKTVAVITDAGMPGVSDPGAELVRAARESDAKVDVLPGPSAMPAALVLSGFGGTRFRFDGFPPRQRSERRHYLESLRYESVPVVWFESPHRVVGLLQDIAAIMPQRRLFVLREYTKKFEQHLLGSAPQVIRELADVRGEYSIVIEGATDLQAAPRFGEQALNLENVKRAAALLRRNGVGARLTAQALQLATGLAKNRLYRIGAEQAGGVQADGAQDGGAQDGGAQDGGPRESGAQDAGTQGGGAPDGGTQDGGAQESRHLQ